MGFKELQKNLPVFSISVVTKITQLTARQIRYYEEKKLFTPKRTEGNTRLFSFNDIDKLLTIKDLLTKGFSLKAIDEIINEKMSLLKQHKLGKLSIMIYLLGQADYQGNAQLDVVTYQDFITRKIINFNVRFFYNIFIQITRRRHG